MKTFMDDPLLSSEASWDADTLIKPTDVGLTQQPALGLQQTEIAVAVRSAWSGRAPLALLQASQKRLEVKGLYSPSPLDPELSPPIDQVPM